MAVKTFRLGAGADGNFGALSEADQTAASRTDGWVVGTGAAGLSSEFDAATKQTAATFSSQTTTAKPASFLTGSTANALKTPAALTGVFAATAWTLTFAVRSTTGTAHRGRMRVRVFRSANASGASATEITGATQVGTTLSAIATNADNTTVVTWSPGSTITLSNEFLFFVLAWETTTAGANGSADVVMRTGQSAAGSRIVTPNFVGTYFGSSTVSLTNVRISAGDNAVPFPSTPVLTNFNFGTGALPSDWTTPSLSEDSVASFVETDFYRGPSTSEGSAAWNLFTAADVEVFLTVVNLTAAGDHIRLMARMNLDRSPTSGYIVFITESTGDWDFLRINGGGSYTSFSFNGGIRTVAAGGQVGLRVKGNKLEGWYCPPGGFWQRVITVTDSAVTAPGYIGIGAGYGIAIEPRYDYFGGGDIGVPSGTTYTGSSTVSVTDTITSDAVRKAVGASTVALVNSRVTAGFRKTFVASTVALVNSRVTAGFRKTFVASTVSLIDTITSGGSRKALGASTVALVNTRVTSAVRKAISSSLVALVNARTSAARILARSGSTTSEVVGVVSSGLISGSTVTHLGASTVSLVDVRVTSATRKTFSASTVPLVNSRVSGSRFTAKGNPGTRGEVVGVTTSGTVFSHPTWSGSSVASLSALSHSKGRVTAKTGSTVNPVVSIVTASRGGWRSRVTVSLNVLVTSDGRTQAAGITVLNQADTIYLGSRHVDAVYVGSVRAWP